jgi:hypothetical protein
MLETTHSNHPSSLLPYLLDWGWISSWPKNRKYVENDVTETCQLKVYYKTNHGHYTFHFIVCAICSTKSFALKWFQEIKQWSIKVFTHIWNFPQNFVFWLMSILVPRAPNFSNTMSRIAYIVPLLLWSNNGTNFSNFEKCSIITKTYQLFHIIKLNESPKSKFHQ